MNRQLVQSCVREMSGVFCHHLKLEDPVPFFVSELATLSFFLSFLWSSYFSRSCIFSRARTQKMVKTCKIKLVGFRVRVRVMVRVRMRARARARVRRTFFLQHESEIFLKIWNILFAT
jgi:hypothetical protein